MAARVPDALRAAYQAAGQDHVFKFIDNGKCTDEQAAQLVAQLSAIDVQLVNELYAETMAASHAPPPADALEPPRGVVSLSSAAPEQRAAWHSAGLDAISRSAAGVLILAGGQGTRLGSDRPKGEYSIGLPSRDVLFALLAKRVARLRVLAAAHAGASTLPSLPLYVMTSPMTDAETRAYWAEHANFGLPARDVTFFSQGTLPCLTPGGKIMLESAGKVAEAPDGNGGIYRGLHTQGVVRDLEARGVVGLHVFAVDNAIVKAGDPTFLGFCMSRGADVGSKACPKAGPHEKVGVLCLRGGAYTVVEYSELDVASAERVDPSTGTLEYNAGNICIHYYATAFLRDACSPARLPKVYHVARKAIPFAHPETGETQSKSEMAPLGNTGIKLESFIFDVFPSSTSMAVLEIDRASEFSPVKNPVGSSEDSPATALALLLSLHASWVVGAGGVLTGEGGVVEVSPLASYEGEGLGGLGGLTLPTPLLVQRKGEALPPVQGGGGGVVGWEEEETLAPGVTLTRSRGGGGLHVVRVEG